MAAIGLASKLAGQAIKASYQGKLSRQAIKGGDRVAALTGARKISRPVRRRHLRLAGLGAIVPVEVPAASPRSAKVPVKLGPRQELGTSPSLEAPFDALNHHYVRA
jgi:hypothetical protein